MYIYKYVLSLNLRSTEMFTDSRCKGFQPPLSLGENGHYDSNSKKEQNTWLSALSQLKEPESLHFWRGTKHKWQGSAF